MRAPATLPPALPKKRKKKRRSLLLSFLGWGFGLSVVGFMAVAAGAGYLLWKASKDLPSYESLANYEPPVMTRIHAHDGALIAEYARERRIFVPINTIPKKVLSAFLSAEDKRFYEHPGIDIIGLGRAVSRAAPQLFNQYVFNKPKRRLEGASTITQQVAKNFLLDGRQEFERKIKEAILAIRIERTYSKDKILELYLNEIFLGIGSYGVAAASLNYFNKELKDLTAEEAAYLAALPKGPNNYHPFKFKEKAIERRNWILGEMANNGYIPKAEADEARAKDLKVNFRPYGAQIFAAEYFAEEVRRAILTQYGEDKLYGGGLSVRTTLDPVMQRHARVALIDGLVSFDRSRGWRGPVKQIDMAAGEWGAALGATEVPADIAPWRMGVVLEVQKTKVVIGLRPAKQQDGKLVDERNAVEVTYDELKWARKFIATDKEPGAVPKQPSDVLQPGYVVYVAPKDAANLAGAWSLMQIPEVGGGLVAMDPHTGRVLAVVGGFSYALSQFDRATQAKRQPGSSFKPLVYAAAIDNGYKPTSIILDAPIEIDQGNGKDAWKPSNYQKDQSFGPSTLRTGIEQSRNQMTVRLAQDMGMPLITEYARRFGVYDDLLPVLSMSLGAGETTVLKMTTAYAMLANGGRQVHATFIDRIQDRWGRTVWRHDERPCDGCKAQAWKGQAEPEIIDDRKPMMDPHTAYQMTSIMEGVIQRGTGTAIAKKLPGVPLAGKTGTTNDYKDVWFVGYSPDLVVGVFVGYDTPKPMGKTATGGAVTAPIFANFMKLALGDKKAVPFRQPPGIKLVRVNPKTGLRSSGEGGSLMEAFKPTDEPDDPNSFLGYEGGSGPTSSGGTTSGSGDALGGRGMPAKVY
jgi:penicillin-binding protein 1A